MHFGLTEEQELLQETVRGFVAGECPPTRLRELFDANEGHDPALWKGLAEMGVAGLTVDEAHGGAGMELLDLALVSEEIGAGALPGPFLGHSLACIAIAKGGSAEQQARWLPALASGESVGTVALGEADDVWDAGDFAVTLTGGRLSGQKRFVPFADVADVIVVGAAGGIGVVEKGADGLRIERLAGIDRTRPVAHVTFADTPAEALAEGAAAEAPLRDAGLIVTAADAFGAANRLTQMTMEYARTREQFGQPIAQFQSVKHQLADMATAVEPCRGLFWYAAYAYDHLPDSVAMDAAVAKSHIGDVAVSIARDAVELHGGIGFTWECDVQMWFKRTMFDRAFLGSPAHHRARVAALGGF